MTARRVFVEGVGWVRAEDVEVALVVAGHDVEGLADAPIIDATEEDDGEADDA